MCRPAFFSKVQGGIFSSFFPAATAPNGQTTADGKDGIKIKQQRWYIEKMARELGYRYETDVPMSGE